MATQEPSSSDAVLLPSIAATSPTVVVKVGTEGKEYILHTELLKHHSGYFRGALSGAFKETDDGVVPITDVEIDAFDVFVDWIYRGTVTTDLFLEAFRKYRLVATRSYILADRLLVPGLKSALMDTYFDFYVTKKQFRPGCGMIVQLCCDLPEEDPLIRLCVDMWSTQKTIYKLWEDEKTEALDLSQGFLVRLMLRMNEVGKKPPSVQTFKREDYNERTRVGG
ncbi:hypothetical protein J4E81_010308 [Alternaria sp. BMP 2799]|nr:hypothetical protein J4E81_010308 [Alternaria sp. BMP 2799]